jgi:hypothetical protein
MEPLYHDRENDIETTVGLPPSKDTINAGIVDLGTSFRVLCDRQFLPLTSYVQQFQDVIEQGVQGQLRRWAPASNGQVRQDKLLELLPAQFRRNAPGLLTLCHIDPQKRGACIESGDGAKTPQFQKPTGGSVLSGNPQPVDRMAG